jgi:hypothetical protein
MSDQAPQEPHISTTDPPAQPRGHSSANGQKSAGDPPPGRSDAARSGKQLEPPQGNTGADTKTAGGRNLEIEATSNREQEEALQARATEAETTKKEEEARWVRAQVRKLDASAQKEEEEARALKAEADEAGHKADKELARQLLALATGWARIGLTILVTLVSLYLLVIGYTKNPLAYPAGFLIGLGLYPLKPWEFFSSTSTQHGERLSSNEDARN